MHKYISEHPFYDPYDGPPLCYRMEFLDMLKRSIFYIAASAAVILLLARAEDVIRYSRDAMNICYELIIPTLFPFFVCSSLLVYSGFGSLLARMCGGIMRPLFNVAPSGAAAFVLGIISGYPLGALTAAQLYRCSALSKAEAERLLSFCSCSGPLFIIGSIGVSLYGKPAYGAALYAIHVAASVIVGIVFRRYGKEHHNSPPMELKTEELPLTEVFAKSLRSSVESIITVCFSIIFFSALSRTLLSLAPLPPLLDAAASGLCEFSTGVLKVSMLDKSLYEKLILTSLIVGFSGIGVHLQVMAVTAGSGLSLKPYILGKLLHGIFAAALTAAVFAVLRPAASVFSPAAAPFSGSCAASALMLGAGIAAAALPTCLLLIKKRSRSH